MGRCGPIHIGLHTGNPLTVHTGKKIQCVQDGEEHPHAFSAADLRAVHAASAESPERVAAHKSRWMLNRGKLPTLDAMSEARADLVPEKNECMTVLKHLKGQC